MQLILPYIHTHNPRTIDTQGRVLAIIKLWWRRAHTRRSLKHLDTDQLADIGVTRTQAVQEAAKPFWKR